MSRLWVFQSNKPFTESETEHISTTIKHYLTQWNAHGASLEGNFTIKYNQFIIIILDETHVQAPGCSIDDMTRTLKKLEQELNLSLLGKTNIAYKESERIKMLPLKEFKKAVSEGIITPETLIFNNSVSTLEEFNTQWEIPIKRSWAKTLVK
ncbi:MAG: ABC transporter ATPase [Flavobacteriales bacterium]